MLVQVECQVEDIPGCLWKRKRRTARRTVRPGSCVDQDFLPAFIALACSMAAMTLFAWLSAASNLALLSR